MAEFEYPRYVLDLRHKLNCATLESAQSGKEIGVLVRPDDDESSAAISAKGTLSEDGEDFTVVVSTGAGTQTHSWNYEWLKNAIQVAQKR